jgi:hypothetical protein
MWGAALRPGRAGGGAVGWLITEAMGRSRAVRREGVERVMDGVTVGKSVREARD